MNAGSSIPPTAAATGKMAFFKVERCPTTISRLISRPTTKKNRAIRPSFIQCAPERANFDSFQEKPSFVFRIWKYDSDHGELAQVSAASVQNNSSTLPVASDLKNRTDARTAGAVPSSITSSL